MMKRITRLCRSVLVCAAAVLAAGNAHAQVSAYTFTQNTGTYTPITGGTVVGYSTVDDDIFNGLPIGFTFLYNNAARTTFNVNGNGWISFGAATQSSTSPLSNTNTGPTTNNVISAAGADLVAGLRFTATTTNASAVLTVVSDVLAVAVGDTVTATNLPAGTTVTSIDTANNTITVSQPATAAGTAQTITVNNGEIRYQVLGSSPNQVLVVQFTNYRRFSQSNVEINFQIKLYEGTNQIEIQYGAMRQLAANTTNNGLQVGLRGNSGTDYNNRTSTSTWTATGAGTANSNTVRLSSTVQPPVGHSYFWNAPNCVTPTNVVLSNVSNTGVTVTFNRPVQGNPLNYEWRLVPGTNSATNGVLQNGFTASATDTVVNISGLTQLTTYSVYVRSVCGAGDSSAFTAIATFSTPCAAITSLPWLEDFETIVTGNDMATNPGCWVRQLISTTNWRSYTQALRGKTARSGTKFMYATYSGNAWLITPGFALTAGTQYEFSFWNRSTDPLTGNNIRIAYGASQNAAGMTNILGTQINPTDTNWSKFTATFTPASTGVYYFGVRDSANITPWHYMVDDFELKLSASCSGTPVAGVTSSTSTSSCPGQTYTLSTSGVNTDAGITYQWIASADGGATYAPIANAQSATYVDTFTTAKTYRLIVTCTGSGLSDTSTALAVTAALYYNCVCAVPSSNCNLSDRIDNVTFAGINNTTTCTSGGYSKYDTPVAQVYKTVAAPISVTVGPGGDEHVAVWIDYDHNGVFDTTEFYFIGVGNGIAVTNNITIPAGAQTGLARMRVRANYFNSASPPQINSTQACVALGTGFGETEDYLVDILDAPLCTNPPVGGTITGDSTICTGNTTQLTLTGYTLGTTLQWQRSTDNNVWADIANATNAFITSDTITDTVYYRVKVICVDSAYSDVITVSLAPIYDCYCAVTADCNFGDVMTNVTFGNINNTTTCGTNGYSQYLSPVDTLFPGETQSISVTVGNPGTGSVEYVMVWIDYNQNGVFETTEYKLIGSGNQSTITNTITVPQNAAIGYTVMRIRSNWGDNDVLFPDEACYVGTFSEYGETEDYLIYIAPPPPCAAPVVAGVANGPSTSPLDSTQTFILTGYTGNVQWQFATSAAGPYTNFGGINATNDTIPIVFNVSDTFYIRAFVTAIGCDPDSTAPVQVIVAKKAGDDVCDAIPLSIGVNGPYSTANSTIQPGEVSPPAGDCDVLNAWCNDDISNTLWFTFTAPASGRIRLNSPDTQGDSRLAIWDAPVCDSLLSATGATLVAANDDDADNTAHNTPLFSAYIDSVICLTPGKTYWVQLDNYSTGTPVITTIVLTDLGAGPVAAFTNLDSTYCVTADSVVLTPTGGTFTGAGVTGNVFTPSAAGVGGPYVITRTYYACYTYSDTVYAVLAAPTLTVDDTTDVTCHSGTNGAVAVTVTGGTTPYAFTWSNNTTAEDLSAVGEGTYTVTVNDANLCSATGSATVNEPDTLLPALDSLVNVSCPGDSNGAVYITTLGGVAPYTFAWSNGNTAEDLTDVAAGSYSLTVTDANGCMFMSPPIPISQPAPISVIVNSVTNLDCNGDADGAINITITGGTAPYTYLWSNGTTTQDLNNLTAGDYTPTITDSKGCVLVGQTFSITEPAVLIVVVDSTDDATCLTATNGAAYITVTGGTTPYSYSWSNSTSNEDLTGVGGGTFDVTVTDSKQCSATAQAIVNANAAVVVTIDSVEDVTCANGSDGEIYITATGGVSPYSYTWSNSTVNEDLTGAAAGNYSVIVNDANGCSTTVTATIADGYALNAVVDSTDDVSCNGGNNGAVYITPTNGQSPYVYSWSNSASTQDITGLTAGTYTLTLTDANGCTYNGVSATVTQATAIVLTSVVTDQVGSANNGAVNVTISGGTSPYTSVWSNSATTEDLTAVAAGVYTTTVTDANGCTATKTDTVDFVVGITAVDGSYSINMYPNPTQGMAYVDVKLDAANDVTVEVYNVAGQIVDKVSEYGVTETKIALDLTQHAAGVYNTKITIGDKTITQRLMVNK